MGVADTCHELAAFLKAHSQLSVSGPSSISICATGVTFDMLLSSVCDLLRRRLASMGPADLAGYFAELDTLRVAMEPHLQSGFQPLLRLHLTVIGGLCVLSRRGASSSPVAPAPAPQTGVFGLPLAADLAVVGLAPPVRTQTNSRCGPEAEEGGTDVPFDDDPAADGDNDPAADGEGPVDVDGDGDADMAVIISVVKALITKLVKQVARSSVSTCALCQRAVSKKSMPGANHCMLPGSVACRLFVLNSIDFDGQLCVLQSINAVEASAYMCARRVLPRRLQRLAVCPEATSELARQAAIQAAQAAREGDSCDAVALLVQTVAAVRAVYVPAAAPSAPSVPSAPPLSSSSTSASSKYHCDVCKGVYPNGRHMADSRVCKAVQRANAKGTEDAEQDTVLCYLCRRMCGESVGKGHADRCVLPGSPACCQAFKPKVVIGVEALEGLPTATPQPSLLHLLGLSHETTTPPPPTIIFGGPGVGKSYLTCELFSALCVLYGAEAAGAVVMLAAYGVVAQNVGGVTIHSWAGLSPPDEGLDVLELVERLRSQPSTKRRWLMAQVILIDDASLLSAEMFDLLEHIARLLRGNDSFFGGIKVCFAAFVHTVSGLCAHCLWSCVCCL